MLVRGRRIGTLCSSLVIRVLFLLDFTDGGEVVLVEGRKRSAGEVFVSKANLPGFFGWCLFKTWQGALLFLPISPLYRILDAGWIAVISSIALLVLPYGLTMVFSDLLSSEKGMRFARFVAWFGLLAGLLVAVVAPGCAVLQAGLISAVMWGAHLTWQVYAVTLRALRLVGSRSLVAAIAFMLFAFFPAWIMNLLYWILPLTSLVLLAVHRHVDDGGEKVIFAMKSESRKHIDLFFHNSLWNAWESLLQGVGIGFLFVSGVSLFDQLAMVGVALLLVAMVLIVGTQVLLEFNRMWFLVVSLAIMIPLVTISLSMHGRVLAVIGVMLFGMGRLQQGIDMRERFKMPYLEVYLVGRNHAIEIFGVLSSVVLIHCLFGDFLLVSTRSAVLSFLLYAVVVAALIYFYAIIRNYENFVCSESTSGEQECETSEIMGVPDPPSESRWIRKVNATAARYGLSRRQADVLKYLSYGRNAASISEKLFISKSTAKSHIYAVYQKLGTHTQQELIDLVAGQEED